MKRIYNEKVVIRKLLKKKEIRENNSLSITLDLY